MYRKICLLVVVVYFLSAEALGKPADDKTFGIMKYRDPSSVCHLPPSGTGMCTGSYPMYYYDAGAKTCRKFIYGGCLGNANRFETEEECMATCGHF